MTRSLAVAFVILALVVVASELLLARPGRLQESAVAMPSLLELHSMAGVHTLPHQEIDDQSLIYPTPTSEDARPRP